MSSYVDDERSVREDEHREIIARWYRELDRIEKRVKEIEAKELMKELMKEWEEKYLKKEDEQKEKER